MKTKILILLLLFSHTSSMMSQQLNIFNDKTYGGDNRDGWPNIYRFVGNQMILTGISFTDYDGDKTDSLCLDSTMIGMDLWLVNIDDSFNIIWNKSIGGSNAEESATLVVDSAFNRIFICAESISNISCEKTQNSYSYPSNNSDFWIYVTDLQGIPVWDRIYGGSSADQNPQIVRLMTGELLLYGKSTSPISFDKSEGHWGMGDYWLVKIDTSGNKLWDKVIGGSGIEQVTELKEYLELVPTHDGGCILCGTTQSPVSGTITLPSIGNYDVLLNKIDSMGNIVWQKRYGGTNGDICESIIETPDHGLIVAGTTKSPQGNDITDSVKGISDIWIIKLDSLGNKIWDRCYGGSGGDESTQIAPDPSGGWFVLGMTSSPADYDVSTTPFGILDFWFFKIDSVGNKIWDVRFGGPGYNRATNFLIQPDSSIILFGQADSGSSATKTDPGKGESDYWLVHFKYNETTGINEPVSSQNISVSPNPSTGLLQLPSILFGSQLTINDLTGRVVFLDKNIKDLSVDLSFLPQGSYLLNFQLNHKHYRAKWIRME